MDFWENKFYLECQHRDSTGTLNHCETLGSGLKDKCLRLGGEGFLFMSWGLSISSLQRQDFTKSSLSLLSAVHQLQNVGGDFDSLL